MLESSKFNLRNKLAFILGGSGLIGKKIVELYLMHGAKVVLLDKFNKLGKKKNLIFTKINITNSLNFEKKIKKIIINSDVPDIFINCTYPKTQDWKNNSFKQIKYKSFKKNTEIHLNSFAWSAKIIADQMKDKGKGSIILLSSVYGVVGQDLNIYEGTNMEESMTYSVIKGGINNFVKLMSSYYGKHKIRVNALCPGGVFNNQNPKFIKNYNKKNTIKKNGNNRRCCLLICFSWF